MICGPSSSTPESQRRRPFICPCGKGYLSYPALFTHVKQKHDGKPPGNVIRPKSQNKRGRPRKLHPGDTPGEGGSERPEFKSLACRLLFGNEEEEKDLGFMISQVESAKQRYRANLDFVPPITPSHLALLCPPPQPPPANNNSSNNLNGIKAQLKEILSGVRGSNWASSGELEELISLNVPYLLAMEEERRSSRRPLGSELWEMDLRTALLEFLDAIRQSLSRGEFRNVELLVGLLIYYFARETPEEGTATTANYVEHLNTFVLGFLNPLTKMPPYNAVYSLRGDRVGRILVLLHEWMAMEGLSGYVVVGNQRGREGEGRNSVGE